MPTGQQYATNVPQTTLTGSVNASATSLSVASSSGWPATPFTACLDIGTSTQEPVDVTAVVGTTWTVTRNIDGTTGFSHAIGATVTHADIGRDFREARTHMDASTNVHGLSGGAAVVGDIQTQTLTNKTLTAPTITNPSVTGTVAGAATYTTPTLDRPVLGTTAPSAPTGSQLAPFSNGGALAVKTAGGTTYNVGLGVVSAVSSGFNAWTFDTTTSVAGLSLAAGFIGYAKITPTYPFPCTQVYLYIGTAGSGLTAGQCFAGIYDSNGTRVAVSADQSSLWTSTGLKTITVSSVNLEPKDYYIAMVSNGTTPPIFLASNNGFGTLVQGTNGSNTVRNSVSPAGGNTSLPTSVTLGSRNTSVGCYWAAL